MRPVTRDGLTALGIAAGYLVCGVIGTALSVPPDGFAIVWPATAFIIAVLLLLPPRAWWLSAAVVPAHVVLAAALQPDVPWPVVVTQVAGNLVLAFATALAVRRAIGSDPRFDTFVTVLKFILIAGLAVPAVINAAILSVHLATGWADDLWLAWRQWMVAGFMPTITIPPALVLAAKGGLTGRPAAAAPVRAELTVVALALFATGVFALGRAPDLEYAALFIVPLPLLLWAAVRTGVGGTSIGLLALTAGMLVPALRHEGPFAPYPSIDAMMSVQVFIVSRAAIMLLLAALMDERRRTATLLQQFETGMQVAASQTDTGLWWWDAVQRRLWLTDNCRAMLGLPEHGESTPYDFLEAVHPDDRIVVGDALRAALTDRARLPVLEFRLLSDGKPRWFVLQTRTLCDGAGRLLSVSGVFRDISERIESRLAVERVEERLATLQDDERRRIAQELHDSTAQHLVAAKLNLLAARKKTDGEVQELVDEAYRSLREATAEIRTFSYLLHSSHLEDQGLRAILALYVPGFQRRTGIETALRVTERADTLPAELQHALLRIVQESLGNTQRHAGATRATVDLRCIRDAMHLVVCDNGKGIGPEEGAVLGERLRLGLGIPQMTVRIRATCDRTCGDCRGTGAAIHVCVPLRSPLPAPARGIANVAREALGAGRG